MYPTGARAPFGETIDPVRQATRIRRAPTDGPHHRHTHVDGPRRGTLTSRCPRRSGGPSPRRARSPARSACSTRTSGTPMHAATWHAGWAGAPTTSPSTPPASTGGRAGRASGTGSGPHRSIHSSPGTSTSSGREPTSAGSSSRPCGRGWTGARGGWAIVRSALGTSPRTRSACTHERGAGGPTGSGSRRPTDGTTATCRSPRHGSSRAPWASPTSPSGGSSAAGGPTWETDRPTSPPTPTTPTATTAGAATATGWGRTRPPWRASPTSPSTSSGTSSASWGSRPAWSTSPGSAANWTASRLPHRASRRTRTAPTPTPAGPPGATSSAPTSSPATTASTSLSRRRARSPTSSVCATTTSGRTGAAATSPTAPRPRADLPASPDTAYRDRGWTTWGDFLGTGLVAYTLREFRGFEDARAFPRDLDVTTVTEWRVYARGDRPDLPDLPPDIPAAPDHHYRDKGWSGWPDFLRVPPSGEGG